MAQARPGSATSNVSARTEALLLRIADADTRRSVEELLREMPALPGPPSSDSLERAHFAVIKLVLEGELALGSIALLYRRDARDLWVNARFADDAHAHEAWRSGLAPLEG
jgi:hypothetical protein